MGLKSKFHVPIFPNCFPGFSTLYRRGGNVKSSEKGKHVQTALLSLEQEPCRQLSRYIRPCRIQYAHTVYGGPPTDVLAVSGCDTSGRIISHLTALPAHALAPMLECKKEYRVLFSRAVPFPQRVLLVLGSATFAEECRLDQAARRRTRDRTTDERAAGNTVDTEPALELRV